MTVPYAQLVAAVRTAGNRAGTIRRDALVAALSGHDATAVQASAHLARLVNADAATVHELEVEIGALEPAAQKNASALAGALAALPEEAAVVSRALLGISGACAGVLYAHVPWSSVIDATLLEACRVTGALFRPFMPGREEYLVLRLGQSLAVPVRGLEGPLLAKRLAELDPEAAQARARDAALYSKLRAALPPV